MKELIEMGELYPKDKSIEKDLIPIKGGEGIEILTGPTVNVESGGHGIGEAPGTKGASKLRSEVIRCPRCGSANIDIGTMTAWGVPVFCRTCEEFSPTRREFCELLD